MLETIAAVPGMVGGALQHLQSLHRIEADYGRIRLLLDEAENERMHLMTFIHITEPSRHDVIVAVRADEIRHREVNHALADTLA